MRYEVNFGSLRGKAASPFQEGQPLRLAILGDFSARANAGKLSTGRELAARKPLLVDVDRLEQVMARLGIELHLPVADEGGAITLQIMGMDSFHPDQLVEKLEIFGKLSSLRQKLLDPKTFDSAAKAVRSLLGTAAVDRHQHRVTKARGATIPNAKLSDFSRLVGRPTIEEADAGVVDLIKQVMRTQVVPNAAPQQAQLVSAIDEALSETLRRVLHHPDFQSLEALWRSVDLLVRRLDSEVQIVLYDVTAEEFAADLSVADLNESGIYQLLVEQPLLDQQQGPVGVIVANYTFEQTPPHADLLGRIAKIAAAAHAPFLASVTNDCLQRTSSEDQHPLTKQAWNDLYQLPEAGYLGLTVPRFMLRWPFGKRTDPIESFEFEEFNRRSGVRSMLWGNGAFLAGLLLGETFCQQGLKDMKLGSIMTVDDLPYYYYVDEDGDQIALPCTDRLLSQRLAEFVIAQRLIPLLSVKGRPEVRLGSMRSLSGELLQGPWGAPRAVGAPISPGAAVSGTFAPPAETPLAPPEDDLDAMLAGLDSPTEGPATGEPAQQMDELDALLAGMDTPNPPAGDDSAMDPDLAALLGDL